MAEELDRAAVQDRLDLCGAAAEFAAAEMMSREARARVIRLARRVVSDATLTDEDAVRAAYPIANGFRLELARELRSEVTRG